MVEIVGLGFWVFGHGNCFVDRWFWVSCSFSVQNSSKKKNCSVVVVVVIVLCLRLRLREALFGFAFFAASRTVLLQDHKEEPVLAVVLVIASRPRGRTSLRWWQLASSPPTPPVSALR
nr:hypothetical protein CFP56_51878 [Quercus suber]